MAEPVAKKRRLSPTGAEGNLPGFANWDLEQKYEQRLRRNQKEKGGRHETLMIKTAEGKVTANPRMNEEAQDEMRSEESDDSSLANDGNEDVDSGVADLEVGSRSRSLEISPKEQSRLAKEELARIAGLISENPEEHIALLTTLSELADSENVAVKKLALATQLSVYKDIIPGYRIRPLSRDDMTAKVSKDVRKLRSFEQGLLGGYKGYINSLMKLASGTSQKGIDQAAAVGLMNVAISCACTLLVSVPHFNCRNELIGILVQKISNRRVDSAFVRAREAFERLFQEDEEGHASLEAVSQLTKMMKMKKYSIHESVLNAFLHLRLLSEFANKASTTSVDNLHVGKQLGVKGPKQKREFRTKRERKTLREQKQVEKEMKEADATVSYEERDKNQAETLKHVFITYFRVLKERVPHLMGAVLEGLAKYSHLINQDFFGDILEALRDLINDAEAVLENATGTEDDENREDQDDADQRNATRESLLCIITAFALLQGQQDVAKSASSLHLDLSFFVTHLYRTLVPLAMESNIELSAKSAHLADPNGLQVPTSRDAKVNVATTTVLLLRSLQSVLLPPSGTKFVPPLRLAAFIKQIHIMALHLPQKSTIAALEMLQQVTKTHGPKVAALWNTEERRGDGVFDARSLDVETSNPFASTIWEGELLRLHFDPKVRDAVIGMEKNIETAKS